MRCLVEWDSPFPAGDCNFIINFNFYYYVTYLSRITSCSYGIP